MLALVSSSFKHIRGIYSILNWNCLNTIDTAPKLFLFRLKNKKDCVNFPYTCRAYYGGGFPYITNYVLEILEPNGVFKSLLPL